MLHEKKKTESRKHDSSATPRVMNTRVVYDRENSLSRVGTTGNQ